MVVEKIVGNSWTIVCNRKNNWGKVRNNSWKLVASVGNQALPIIGFITKICWKMTCQLKSASPWHTKEGLPANGMLANGTPANSITHQPRSANHWLRNQGLLETGISTKVCQCMACQRRSASQWHAIQGMPVNNIAHRPRSASEPQTNQVLPENK